jgi:hypothetical protein
MHKCVAEHSKMFRTNSGHRTRPDHPAHLGSAKPSSFTTSGCKKGTGVVISASGYVATSYHLFTDEKNRPFDKINAVLGKVGESFDCDQPLGEVVRLDRVISIAEVDAALLKIVSPKPYAPVPACLGPVIPNGSPLYVLGFPLGLPLAPQQVNKGNDTGKQWQIAGQFDSGSSGDPYFHPAAISSVWCSAALNGRPSHTLFRSTISPLSFRLQDPS